MKDWSRVPIETVPMNQIIPTKMAPPFPALLKVLLVMGRVLEPRSGDQLPHLEAKDGTSLLTVHDGHHRLTVLALLGRKSVRARVLR